MRKRSLGEWLQYLEQLHPSKIDLGLSRVSQVAQRLGLLPFPARVITVAGTNGKGSVVYSCERLLRAAGFKTGRYTSPHVLRYNERIAVNAQATEDAVILLAFEAIESARQDISLTYFEFATLAALWVFREESVDVALLEVGLGGRLDAVNIVDCDVAVVTAIDLDHQAWLGDTVDRIAPEKAAIARREKPLILAEPSYPSTLFTTLDAIGAKVLQAGKAWHWKPLPDAKSLELSLTAGQDPITIPIPDGLRAANVAAAVRAGACLFDDEPLLREAAQSLADLHVPARRQRFVLGGRELLLDVAHNPAAMTALVEYLELHPVAGKTVAVLGLMSDKDLDAMTQSLARSVDGACALAIVGIDRAQAPERVWEALDTAGIAIVQAEFSAAAVWSQLWAGTGQGDRIVVCGSFYSVAGIIEELLERGLISSHIE
ncbi:MAG: folylpolyglutamate synthase/dihydrofolate synthase family protein [Congregibacter sp.]